MTAFAADVLYRLPGIILGVVVGVYVGRRWMR